MRLKTGQTSMSSYAEASNEKPLDGSSRFELFEGATAVEASVGDRFDIACPSTYPQQSDCAAAPIRSAGRAVISAKAPESQRVWPRRLAGSARCDTRLSHYVLNRNCKGAKRLTVKRASLAGRRASRPLRGEQEEEAADQSPWPAYERDR